MKQVISNKSSAGLPPAVAFKGTHRPSNPALGSHLNPGKTRSKNPENSPAEGRGGRKRTALVAGQGWGGWVRAGEGGWVGDVQATDQRSAGGSARECTTGAVEMRLVLQILPNSS